MSVERPSVILILCHLSSTTASFVWVVHPKRHTQVNLDD